MDAVALGPTLALAFALTGVPALLVAGAIAKGRQRQDPDAHQSRVAQLLARMMRMVAAVLFTGAAAMLWAGDLSARVVGVVLAVALAVNLLAVAMLIAVLRSRRGGPSK